jgi:hypothetical protein
MGPPAAPSSGSTPDEAGWAKQGRGPRGARADAAQPDTTASTPAGQQHMYVACAWPPLTPDRYKRQTDMLPYMLALLATEHRTQNIQAIKLLTWKGREPMPCVPSTQCPMCAYKLQVPYTHVV